MPRITPISPKKLIKIFELAGFRVDRKQGSHIVMTKPGALRSIVIPERAEVCIDVIKSNMRTAGMTPEEYHELFKKV